MVATDSHLGQWTLTGFSCLIDGCILLRIFLLVKGYLEVLGEVVVDLEEEVPDGYDFVSGVDEVGFGDVSESASGFGGDNGGQGGGNPVGGNDVVPGDVFDFLEFVPGGEVAHGDDLDILFPAVGDVEEEVAEIAQAFGFFHFGFDGFLCFFVHAACGVEDVSDVGAVLVIAAAEEGGVFIEEHGLDGSHIGGQAVDILGDVVIFNVENFSYFKICSAAVGV